MPMPKFNDTLHIHVYDETSEADDNLVAEHDVEPIETYDDYVQYGFRLGDQWIEIRVPMPYRKYEP